MKEVKRFFALRRIEFWIWTGKVLRSLYSWSNNKGLNAIDAGKKLL